ncbi:MAG: SatD family protein [Acidimicrobiia bacterium]
MPTTSPEVFVAVIGDVIGSRRHPDRAALQECLRDGFLVVAEFVSATQPFAMTIGDEFQGLFETVEEATTATFVLQVALTGRVGLRFGVGVGEVIRMADAGPYQQDGSAWWRAREAIDMVRAAERSRGTPPRWATGLVDDRDDATSIRHRYLQLRDHIVAGIDEVDADIVVGLMQGHTQSAIAERLGIDKGAVSRRVGRHGLAALLFGVEVGAA